MSQAVRSARSAREVPHVSFRGTQKTCDGEHLIVAFIRKNKVLRGSVESVEALNRRERRRPLQEPRTAPLAPERGRGAGWLRQNAEG